MDKCCDISQRLRLVKGSSAASVAGTIAGEEERRMQEQDEAA